MNKCGPLIRPTYKRIIKYYHVLIIYPNHGRHSKIIFGLKQSLGLAHSFEERLELAIKKYTQLVYSIIISKY